MLLLENRKGVAIPISGRMKALTLTWPPKMEIIQAVKVVPTLAPMMTAMESASDISPAFTKLTTITVEADED